MIPFYNHIIIPKLRFSRTHSILLSTIMHKYSTSHVYKSKWAVSSTEFPNVISSPCKIEPTYGITIPEFLKQHLHKWENAIAFECGITGRKYTHGEIFKKSDSFAAALKQHGLKRRDVVCIFLPNIPEYPIVTLGIWEAGLIASPINSSYTPDEVAKQINDCQGKSIVTLPALLPIVQSAKIRCPILKSIIVIGEAEGCHSFSDMLKTDPSSFKLMKGADINSLRETAVIPYSSGTTGPPKGVELTHSTFSTNLLQITYPGYRQTRFFEKGNIQERFIAILPFFHMYGLQIIMAMGLFQGAHIVCLPQFLPGSYIEAVKKHRPTTLHLVTPLISFINSCPDITTEDLKETKAIIAGAAPVGSNLIDGILTKVDHYLFFQEGYGMTEISSVASVIPPEIKNTKLGSCGVLLPGTSCKIVDLNSGESVGPNSTGEILIQGPQIMKGYFNNEEATHEAIGVDGFLRTGDIGYYDEDGFLYIVDRLKELIKVKGLQVAPAELENVLRQHPEIADVAVIGVKHDKLGEAPRCYVVPKTKSLTAKSVSDFLEGKVASHKKLVGGVEFIDAIPKAASGKILRRVLSQDYYSKN